MVKSWDKPHTPLNGAIGEMARFGGSKASMYYLFTEAWEFSARYSHILNNWAKKMRNAAAFGFIWSKRTTVRVKVIHGLASKKRAM